MDRIMMGQQHRQARLHPIVSVFVLGQRSVVLVRLPVGCGRRQWGPLDTARAPRRALEANRSIDISAALWRKISTACGQAAVPSPREMALFRPFRALGYVTDDTPFAIQRRGQETFVTLSVGESWQVYNCAKLTLSLIGPQLQENITALAAKGDLTYAAHGSAITVCKRVHRLSVLQSGSCSAPVVQMICMGEHMLALSSDGLQVWREGEWEDGPQVEIPFGAGFKATCMAHPDTYLNKVVIGAADGKLQLWNFMSKTKLYEYQGWGSSVRCVVAAPALDVVGVGLNDGRVVLHNLKSDEEIAVFENASGTGTSNTKASPSEALRGVMPTSRGQAVSSIAFRDVNVGVPIMAAAGASGAITFWNLQERRLHAISREAHNGRVCALHFFAGEPLLMSSGKDNSVKQWVLDAPEGPPRLLRFRAGHAAPPSIIKHYGQGTSILSAGSDLAFRMFSCIQDQQSKELSQRNIEKRAKKLKVRAEELKLPRVVALDDCQVRERDWANIVTAHEGDSNAYTWLLKDAAIGEHVLAPPARALVDREAQAGITAVAISRCGNFAFTGSTLGTIHRFNLQSGIHRGAFRQEGGSPAHDGTVVGLASDSCNQSLLSCSYDGWLRRWDFKKRTVTGCVELGRPAMKMAFHTGSSLLAVASSDLSITMYDTEALTAVRRFKGHADRITDMRISTDARWLLSSSMDGTLRVWDVPSASILQVLDMGASVTSLSLSPAMEMLATCHPDQNGIYLWSNNQLFGSASELQYAGAGGDSVPLRATLSLPKLGKESETAGKGGSGSDSDSASEIGSDDGDNQQAQDEANGRGAPALRDARGHIAMGEGLVEPEMVTVSLLPRSQWESLGVLDIIMERNKPTEPVKKPEAAPFFLPTDASASMGRQPLFDLSALEPDNSTQLSHIQKMGTTSGSGSAFKQALAIGAETGDFAALAVLLKSMTPSAIDMEVRARELLEGAADEDVAEVDALLQFVESQVALKCDFEFIQAFFRMFLKVHGDGLIEHQGLANRVRRIQVALKESWEALDGKCHSIRCMLGFFCGQA